MSQVALVLYWCGLIGSVVATKVNQDARQLSLHGRMKEEGQKSNVPFPQLYVPKKLFYCFYIWGAIFNLVNSLRHPSTLFVGTILTIHLLRRTYEQLYIMNNYAPNDQMHLFAFIIGLTFYPAASLTLCAPSKSSHSYAFPFLLFALGSVLQFLSHQIYGVAQKKRIASGEYSNLALPKNKSPEFARVMLQGFDPFALCLSPHYFGELLIYISFFLMKWSFASFFMLTAVTLIMITSAENAFNWWQKKFNDTTTNTYKLVPMVW